MYYFLHYLFLISSDEGSLDSPSDHPPMSPKTLQSPDDAPPITGMNGKGLLGQLPPISGIKVNR